MKTMEEILDEMTVENMELSESLPDNAVRCVACGHRCLIREGRRGICQVRYNRAARCTCPWGYVAGLQADPIEKKPFYHVLPGSDALTFGMLGCDFHCAFCQNWVSSQALRDPARMVSRTPPRITRADRGGSAACRCARVGVIVQRAADHLRVGRGHLQAAAAGLATACSSPTATPRARCWSTYAPTYRLQDRSQNDATTPVPPAGRRAATRARHHPPGARAGLVAGNGHAGRAGLQRLQRGTADAGRFITSVSPDIPWHVTAFHPDYKMTEPHHTPATTLRRAAEIGQEAGLRFVYAGNLPGAAGI